MHLCKAPRRNRTNGPCENLFKGSVFDAGAQPGQGASIRLSPPRMDLRMDRPPQYCRLSFGCQPQNARYGVSIRSYDSMLLGMCSPESSASIPIHRFESCRPPNEYLLLPLAPGIGSGFGSVAANFMIFQHLWTNRRCIIDNLRSKEKLMAVRPKFSQQTFDHMRRLICFPMLEDDVRWR